MVLFDSVGVLVKLEREWRMLDPERGSSKSLAKTGEETLNSRRLSRWLPTHRAKRFAANDT